MAHDRLRRALREPVLCFVLLGAGMFGLWYAGAGTGGREGDAGRGTIVVDRERVRGELQAQLGRAPTDDELAAAIDRFVGGEVLYREGLALGLDRDDPVIRQRVIELVVSDLEPPSEPDDAALRAFMDENAARYAGAARYDFVMVTLPRTPSEPDDARARQVLEALRGGADPKAVEVRLASGRRFSAASLTGTYGKDIAAAVMEQPPGEWRMVAIERGWTLVKVEARHAGASPTLESVRNRVTLDWKEAQREATRRQWMDQWMEDLRGRYTVTREP